MSYEYVWIDGERVEVNVAQALQAMAAEFKRVFGYDLLVSSGTRTRAEQDYLYWGWINRLPGFNLAAKGGYSNHEESGPNGPRSVDLRDTGHDAGVTVIGSERSLWLRDNCHRWGFRNDGYGFSPKEAWHFTFTGRIGVPVVGVVADPKTISKGDDVLILISSSDSSDKVILKGRAYAAPLGQPLSILAADELLAYEWMRDHQAIPFRRHDWTGERIRAVVKTRGMHPYTGPAGRTDYTQVIY